MSGFIKTFNTVLGPKAIGPYSTVKVFNGTMYISGQVGLDPKTGELISQDLQIQVRRALQNLKTILQETGVDFSYILKATLFLRDMNDFTKVNSIYAEYFKTDPPARSCVAVAGLPKDAKFEIEVIVAFPYANL